MHDWRKVDAMEPSEAVKRQRAEIALQAIAELPDKWNMNGAPAFSADHVEAARSVLEELSRAPVITPSAMPSIQLDYKDAEARYLEFEIYADRRVKQYFRRVRGRAGESKTIRLDEIADAADRFFAGTL